MLTRLQGGNVLGNGTWVNVGGNEGVTYGVIPEPDEGPVEVDERGTSVVYRCFA
jgi:hypothetical protein